MVYDIFSMNRIQLSIFIRGVRVCEVFLQAVRLRHLFSTQLLQKYDFPPLHIVRDAIKCGFQQCSTRYSEISFDGTNAMVYLPLLSVPTNQFVLYIILCIFYVGISICSDELFCCLRHTTHILRRNLHIQKQNCLRYTTYIIHRKLYLYIRIILLYQVYYVRISMLQQELVC